MTIATRTREYIDAHYREKLRSEDLSRAVGAGVRQIQREFERRFQTTPTGYLRIMRLDAARRALLAADAANSRVTDVALSCGFSHLGRFSVEFRSQFGELPSEVLRRSR